jgi:hypothetical protein
VKKVTARRNRYGSLNSRFPPLFTACYPLVILLVLLSPKGNAQTALDEGGFPPGDIPVAIMPFLGDDLAFSAQLQEQVAGKLDDLAGFTPRMLSAEKFPEHLALHPDEPPDPSVLGDSPFVLTGEYYFDSESLEHFQLWLWNSSRGALIYTDEMVFENSEEVASYLPPLVSWIFSQISKPVEKPVEMTAEIPGERVAEIPEEGAPEISGERAEEATEERTPEIPGERTEKIIAGGNTGGGDKSPLWSRLYLGLRGGASFNTYDLRGTGTYQPGSIKSIGLETALAAELRILYFLSVQAEAGFNLEAFMPFILKRQGNEEIFTNDLYRVTSFQVPLLFKVPLPLGKLRPSLYLGPYVVLLLLPIKNPAGSYSYRMRPPFGIIWGMDLGYAFGPGELFFDLRYEMNLGMTVVQATTLQYNQSRISMSLGYRFGLWNRRNRQEYPSKRNPGG